MTDVLSRLAHALSDRYRIERELGAGGMATVYLAHDLRHDRPVAVKVLRPELAAILGGGRFLAEIKTTANLQHPHILSLFDSGEADGLVYYVMPFVEGESLRERLTRERQLPVEEAVRIAREVADALAYAHQRGIVHRDIKPENILLHGGHAMVADFGIALAASRSEGGTRLTETGMSLGTPHYMAPEQAMGEREITPRADIYALGCVLYEMLTAEPPFTGATAQAIIARVMTEEPRSLTLQRRTIPPHVEAAVHTALQKLPADRFASAKEFADALGNPAFSTAALPATAQRLALRRDPVRLAALAVPWVLLLGLAGIVVWQRVAPRAPAPVYRFGIELPRVGWADQPGATMALSPDGKVLVFSGRDTSGSRLYLRPLDRLEPVPIAGSDGGSQPFFSPDGRWIGFLAGGHVLRVPAAGGPAETMCDLQGNAGVAWLDAGTILLTGAGMTACTIAGGTRRLMPAESVGIAWPYVLPGGKAVLYTSRRSGQFQLAVYDVRRHVSRSLNIAGTDARWVNPDWLVYANLDGSLRAVRFDPRRLEVTGDPVLVAEGMQVGTGGAAKLALAPNGTLVGATGETGQLVMDVVDRQGRGVQLPATPQRYAFPRIAPDGRRVAVTVGTVAVSANIWVFDRGQGTLARLTFDSLAGRAAWSPDGRTIAYVSQTGATASLRRVQADGSAPPEPLLADSQRGLWEVSYAAGGHELIVRTGAGTSRDIYRVLLDSNRRIVPLLHTTADEFEAAISPDGRWLAYVSNESGRNEIYVRSYPDMGARYQISLSGGIEPRWLPHGGELFYRAGGSLMSATVRTTPSFDVIRRTALFSAADYAASPIAAMYDVMPDGQHFVMIRRLGSDTHVMVMLNFFDNLLAGHAAMPDAAH